MDANLKEIIGDIFKMELDERVAFGQISVKKIVEGFSAGGLDAKRINIALINFVKLFVSADRNCVNDEWDYFKAVTGTDISAQDFFDKTNGGADPQFIKACFEFIDILTPADRRAVALFCAAFIACDEKITENEYKLLERIYYKK